MAAVDFWVSSEVKDGNKAPTTLKTYVVAGSGLLADISSFLASYTPLLDAVIQAQIVRQWLHIPLVLPAGLKAAPVSGSNNSIGALETFNTAVVGEPYSYWTPAWIPAGFQAANQNIVDLGNAAVLAYNNFLLATTNTCQIADEDFNTLAGAAPTSAIKTARKFRRALKRAR